MTLSQNCLQFFRVYLKQGLHRNVCFLYYVQNDQNNLISLFYLLSHEEEAGANLLFPVFRVFANKKSILTNTLHVLLKYMYDRKEQNTVCDF